LAVGAAAVAGAYLGGTALAQDKNKPAAPAAATPLRTRVAFLNLHETLKNYNKVKALRDEMKSKEEEFMKVITAKQKRAETVMAEAKATGTTQARKDQIEAELKQINFDVENHKNETRKQVTKYYTDRMAEFFREAYAVTSEYAAANGIDIVLQYNEEWDAEYHTPARVVQRMNLPFWPVYYDQKTMDITTSVAAALNQRFAVVGGAKAPAPGAGAPAGGNGVVPAGGTKQ
jgi:Skp family chaperone for outer membrane proteins